MSNESPGRKDRGFLEVIPKNYKSQAPNYKQISNSKIQIPNLSIDRRHIKIFIHLLFWLLKFIHQRTTDKFCDLLFDLSFTKRGTSFGIWCM